MRRKGVGFAGVILTGIMSYGIPKYLEIRGVINQGSYWLPLSMFIAVLLFLIIAVWGYWPDIKRIEAKKGVSKKMLNIGLGLGIFGIICLIVSGILVLPRLSVPVKDTRIPLQIQLDSLIDDLTAYKQNIPPTPLQGSNESWQDYNQRLDKQINDTEADLVNKFYARIADTINKLYDLRIISDSEYQEDQEYINSTTAVYARTFVGSGLLSRLCQDKADLDSYFAKWGIATSNSP
jgi:hypothetical protein